MRTKVKNSHDAFRCYTDAILLNQEEIVTLVEPAVAASCAALSPSDIASLPLPLLKRLLSRSDLNVKEDFIFEVIQEFVKEHGKSTTEQEISELWTCCRIPFLSYKKMAQIMHIPEIPHKFLSDGLPLCPNKEAKECRGSALHLP